MAENFVSKNINFKQIKREENLAIYELTSLRWGKEPRYEVFKIKIAPRHIWPNGQISEEHEQYPGDNAFGKVAWFCMNLERAEKKFKELTNKKNEKEHIL